MLNEEDLTENFKTQSPISYIVQQYSFWLEILLMLIVPFPGKRNGDTEVITWESINWLDNSGLHAAQSHKY